MRTKAVKSGIWGWLGACVVVWGLSTPALALAEGDWSLEAEGVTDVPLHLGARLELEMPWRLRLSTAVGGMPGAYVDLINTTVVAFEGYDDQTAELVRQSLQSSLVWRLHAGWRPFEARGFFFDLGYTFVGLGGGVSTEALITALTGFELPMTNNNNDYSVQSALHMLGFEVGWRWALWERLSLRASLGFVGTIAAQSRVEANFTPRFPAFVDGLESDAEAFLDDTYTSAVFSPTLTVALGYRVF